MTEMLTQCQWTNERVLEFLELYQSEPLLWNPMIRNHKNRNAVADAWERIKTNFAMTCTITELKKKRESLMSTYRLYRKKTQDSVRSGASSSEIFQSSSFAYELMDSFLASVYNKSDTKIINTETQFSNQNYLFDEADESMRGSTSKETPMSASTSEETLMSASTSRETPMTTSAKKRRATEVDIAKQKMNEAVGFLKTMSERRSQQNEVDEVDLYCQLLAKKIKKINEEERENIMHEIDEFMYQRKRSRPNFVDISTSSPSSVYSSSSHVQQIYEQNYPQQVQVYSTQGYQKSSDTSFQQNDTSTDILQKAFSMCHDNQ